MGKKHIKDHAEKAPESPPPVAADPAEEHEEVLAAKARAKAAEGSAFGQEVARIRRELFGSG